MKTYSLKVHSLKKIVHQLFLITLLSLINWSCSKKDPTPDETLQTDGTYVWVTYPEKKQYLLVNSKLRIYQVEDISLIQTTIDELAKKAPQAHIRHLEREHLIVVELKNSSDPFPTSTNIKSSLPGYLYPQNDHHLPYNCTNQVLLKPKANIAIAEIERAFPQLRFTDMLTNTYLAEIDLLEHVISIANQIQESGLVEFCHANYLLDGIINPHP